MSAEADNNVAHSGEDSPVEDPSMEPRQEIEGLGPQEPIAASPPPAPTGVRPNSTEGEGVDPAEPAEESEEEAPIDEHRSESPAATNSGGGGASSDQESKGDEAAAGDVARDVAPSLETVLSWSKPVLSVGVMTFFLLIVYLGLFATVELALLGLVVGGLGAKLYNEKSGTDKPVRVTIPLRRTDVEAVTGALADGVMVSVKFMNDVISWGSFEVSVKAFALVWLLWYFGGMSVVLLSPKVQLFAVITAFATPFINKNFGSMIRESFESVAVPQIRQIEGLVTSKIEAALAAVPPAITNLSPTMKTGLGVVVALFFAYFWLKFVGVLATVTIAALGVTVTSAALRLVGGHTKAE